MKKMKQDISAGKKFKRSAIIGLIASILILISINIISSFLYFRIDLTKDKRHSLSPSTIELLESLNDKVYIKVYLKGDNLPADYRQFAKKTKEMPTAKEAANKCAQAVDHEVQKFDSGSYLDVRKL